MVTNRNLLFDVKISRSRILKAFRKIVFFLLLFCSFSSNAQLTGIKNIPGDYADLATAISMLNSMGVGAGGVTLNVVAANPQTATAAVYQITATGTASNPITIQGNANIITYTGTAGTLDGVFVLSGSDYVTIDNFVINGDATTEWGVALLTPIANNGASNNKVQNCAITLNKTNLNSVGIYSAHHTAAVATVLTVTNVAGTNSYNKYYNNTIQNCYNGYSITGFTAAAPYDLYDQQNEIGTSGSGRSQILNFGGGANQAQGVFAISQNKIKIFKTNINSTGGSNNISTLYGINNSTGLNSNIDIYNDTITLVSAAPTSVLYGINNTGGGTGAGNTVNIYNNVIQNCTYSTATSGSFRGISQTATATYTNIYNNKVINNNLPGTGELAGIYYGGSSATIVLLVNINNNEVRDNAKTGSAGFLYMIYASASTNTTKCFDNICYNNVQNAASTGATYGYYNFAIGYNEYVYNNQIYNCTGGTVSGTFDNNVGIRAGTGSGPTYKYIYNNTIYGLSSSGQTGGIWVDYATIGNVYQNKIYNITSNSATIAQAAYGINVGTNVNSKVSMYNNFISEIKAPSSTNLDAIYGILIQGAAALGQINVYYNSVYLNATSSSVTTFGSAALFCGANPVSFDMRNNILVNQSVPGTTGGISSAFKRGTLTGLNSTPTPLTSLTNFNLASGNNCLFAGSPAANKLIYTDGTNNDQTIFDYKNRVSPREQSSFSELPPFVNVAVSPYDLHLGGSTQCESTAQPLAPVSIDFDGALRSGTFSDVGADEFTGIAIDASAPLIQYTLLGNDIVNTSRTLNAFALIKDASNINTTVGTNPRLYYKKSTHANTFIDNTNASDGWKYAEATNATSPFNFVIDYTKLFSGGTLANDIIQYFVVAQDLAITPNVGINAGGFTTAPASVNLSVTNFPITGSINQFRIVSSTFSGIINVGTAEAITSLTNVGGIFQQLKSSVLTGDVTIQIKSDLTAETGTYALSAWGEVGSGAYKISIVPDAAVIRTISGASAAQALIRLDSADRVNIDGRFGGSGNFLRIRNTDATKPGILLLNDAQNNTIRNCIIESNNTTVATVNTAGGLNIGNSNVINGTGNDNNFIIFNEVRDRSDIAGTPLNGIYAHGSVSSLDIFNSGNTISNNNVHDFFSATVTTQTGIQINVGNTTFNIDSNSVYQTLARIYTTTGLITRGILINQSSPVDNVGGYNIRNNFIGGTSPRGGTSGSYWSMSSSGIITNIFQGITVSTGLLPTLIKGNVIKNIDHITMAPTAATTMFTGLSANNGKFSLDGNQIGAPTGNDSIKITINLPTSGTPTTSFLAGIIAFNGTASTTDITNNTLGGISILGSTTSAIFTQLIQFQGTPSSNGIISGNSIGSRSTANSVQLTCPANPQSIIFGIRTTFTSGVSTTLSGNTIQNITDNSNNAATSDFGILMTNTVGTTTSQTIINNVINNIACASNATSAVLNNFGISFQNIGGANSNISGNDISGLRSNSTGAFNPYPIGINITHAASGGTVSKNKIYNLTNTAIGATAGIYGLNVGQGSNWNVNNNMISIDNGGNANNLSINGIIDGITNGTLNAYYNTVNIGGSGAGAQNSYGFIRFGNSTISLRNNLLVNSRNSGAGFSYAIANSLAENWLASYNTMITPTSTNVGEWLAVGQSFSAWKAASGGDKESYAELSSTVLPSNLFNDAPNGDLTIKVSNDASWYVNGKGIAGVPSGSILSDFGGDARGSTLGIPTDIGADEFTPDGGVIPPLSTPSAAPANSTTTTYSFGGRIIGEITWGAAGTVPTNIDHRYYSGNQGAGAPAIAAYSYSDIIATGGAGYDYNKKLYYTEAEKNALVDATIQQIKYDSPGPWLTIGGTQSSDAAGKYVTTTGLTNFSLFSLSGPTPCSLIVINSLNSGAGSLREAVGCALTGSTITIDPSVSMIALTASLSITGKTLTLKDGDASRVMITLDSDVSNLNITASGAAILDNLHIKDLSATKVNPAVLNDGTLTLKDTKVSGDTGSLNSPTVKNNGTGNVNAEGTSTISNQ